MKKLAWVTDIHLNFLDDEKMIRSLKELDQNDFDYLLITGDIAQGNNIRKYLSHIAENISKRVFFVLGNHDFYRSSISAVNQEVGELCKRYPNLCRLGSSYTDLSDCTILTDRVAIIGHDGWADGRFGNYEKSGVILNDYRLIDEFIGLDKRDRFRLLNHLGDAAALYFEEHLPKMLSNFDKVILLIHAPPFREACWHTGYFTDDDWLPHFSCKAVGDVLLKIMNQNPAKELRVLCGHTHISGAVQISDNIFVETGRAEYGKPELWLQRIIEVE